MRTLAVIFVLALISIAFEIYSDAALTSAQVSHTSVPDPATVVRSNAARLTEAQEITPYVWVRPPGGGYRFAKILD